MSVLERLDLSYCYQLSDWGICSLGHLTALRVLKMAGEGIWRVAFGSQHHRKLSRGGPVGRSVGEGAWPSRRLASGARCPTVGALRISADSPGSSSRRRHGHRRVLHAAFDPCMHTILHLRQRPGLCRFVKPVLPQANSGNSHISRNTHTSHRALYAPPTLFLQGFTSPTWTPSWRSRDYRN